MFFISLWFHLQISGTTKIVRMMMNSKFIQQQKMAVAILLFIFWASQTTAQMIISGPMGVYGSINAPVSTTAAGGKIVVGNGGNWNFSGNIISADKGNSNAPTVIGRAETILFDGSGTFTNTGNFMVDGYAAASNQANSFMLPLGNGSTAYPVTVPAGASVTAAYFDGSNYTQTALIMNNNGTSATVYSPYIDMPSGLSAGSYTFSYPAGFSNTAYSSLLSSNNTMGTTSATTFSLLANVANFTSTAGTTTTTLAATGASEIYFASSVTVLPVVLVSFRALQNKCVATLSWQTSTEINSSYYSVEYGNDGNSFSQLTKIASKNSSTGASYTDAVKLNSGINYFRLRMVDIDGHFTYSATIALNANGNCSAAGNVAVSPNPAIDIVNIQGLQINSLVRLVDINGKKLMKLIATNTNQQLNISQYAKGVYLLQVEDATGAVRTVKIVKP